MEFANNVAFNKQFHNESQLQACIYYIQTRTYIEIYKYTHLLVQTAAFLVCGIACGAEKTYFFTVFSERSDSTTKALKTTTAQTQ